MTIEILPARLANQIAAGEVVERPASVVKELIENSLDAGATSIKIDIEKGGAKRIRIIDNGQGIAKEELTLALSRHATSKIKNLTDLEGIASLGFRGEALASISSVARLTLTSKPANQETAWQANAQGRDMQVDVQPAAHGDGTTIDVLDLFFNTPARRKFLRTEKTEFTHIEEVVKRVALARFDVSFTLTHNHKIIRQYRVAKTQEQYQKRVAQICGQGFIDNAIYIDCQHESLHLKGWLALPCFNRKQNDLCYSYVNGRMMRDKLINHAIRQAYSDLLPVDTYPAFVLFLTLDVRDVDVNVHPAKHEVRFHQSRYVHDFIFSVCQRSISQQLGDENEQIREQAPEQDYVTVQQEYVSPLRNVNEPVVSNFQPNYQAKPYTNSPSRKSMEHASQAYQQLMTTAEPVNYGEIKPPAGEQEIVVETCQWLAFVAPHYVLFSQDNLLRLVSTQYLMKEELREKIQCYWQKGFTSQPLLLPVSVRISTSQMTIFCDYQASFVHMGIVCESTGKDEVKIKQFPAILREKDVSKSFVTICERLDQIKQSQGSLLDGHFQQTVIELLVGSVISEQQAIDIWQGFISSAKDEQKRQLRLNSVEVDLTSYKNKVEELICR
ncbi:DNA mismatch repair endonuclease MutL [Thalassotalea ganghwensis]